MISRFAALSRRGQAAAGASARVARIHTSPAALAHVLLLDNINPLAAEIFEDRGHTTVVHAAMSEEELLPVSKMRKTEQSCQLLHSSRGGLLQEISKYDGVIVRSSTQITANVLKVCPNSLPATPQREFDQDSV